MLPRQSDGSHCFFQMLCKVQVVTVLESPGNRRSATTEVDDMAITVVAGMGEYVYEYQPEWPRLPVGQGFRGISGVAVDSHDRVYRDAVFQRQGTRGALQRQGPPRRIRPGREPAGRLGTHGRSARRCSPGASTSDLTSPSAAPDGRPPAIGRRRRDTSVRRRPGLRGSGNRVQVFTIGLRRPPDTEILNRRRVAACGAGAVTDHPADILSRL